MRLPNVLIFFFQAVLDVKPAVLAKSPEEVSGYLGDNIKLLSGANPSWGITRIEWSIFRNNTWIATYQKKNVNVERVPQYKGRLTLNIKSGDLTIHNLTADDAREYYVDLQNSEGEDITHKIKLTAKQKLKQPSVQIVTSTSIESGCLIVMKCSSPDTGVNLSWNKPPGVHTINNPNPSDSSSQLFAFVNTTQKFDNFTCTSSQNTESVSSKPATPKCDVLNCPTQPSPTVIQTRASFSFPLLLGGFVAGCVFTLIIIHCCGERIKSAVQHLKEKMCSPV